LLNLIILQSIRTDKNRELTLQREHHIRKTELFKGNCSRLKLKAYHHNSTYLYHSPFSTNENELIDKFLKAANQNMFAPTRCMRFFSSSCNREQVLTNFVKSESYLVFQFSIIICHGKKGEDLLRDIISLIPAKLRCI